jgi:hypothetical protein
MNSIPKVSPKYKFISDSSSDASSNSDSLSSLGSKFTTLSSFSAASSNSSNKLLQLGDNQPKTTIPPKPFMFSNRDCLRRHIKKVNLDTKLISEIKYKLMNRDDALSIISKCRQLIADGKYLTAQEQVQDLCKNYNRSISRQACNLMCDIEFANNNEIKAIQYTTVAAMQGYYSDNLLKLCKKNNMHRATYFWAAARYHMSGNDEDKELKDSIEKNIPIKERRTILAHAAIVGLTDKKIPSNAYILRDGNRWYKNITDRNYEPSDAI